jgi:hypothetical protein
VIFTLVASSHRSGTNRLVHELNHPKTSTTHHEKPCTYDAAHDKDKPFVIVSPLVVGGLEFVCCTLHHPLVELI